MFETIFGFVKYSYVFVYRRLSVAKINTIVEKPQETTHFFIKTWYE